MRGVLAEHLPTYRVERVVALGEGQDNVAFDVNGELVVRFAKAPDPAETDREARLLAEAAESYVPETVPVVHRGPVEEFLAAEPPSARPESVFSHNDLGVEHVLVDPREWTVTGVIDWTDAAFTDPAYDLGLLLRDLGPFAFEAALDAYGSGEPRERAVFLARCTVLEDLAYGIRSGKRVYAENALASMGWLFC